MAQPGKPQPKVPAPRKKAASTARHELSDVTVERMINVFAEQAEKISEQSQEFQKTWVDTVVEENNIFKRRNRVLVIMVAILLALTIFAQGRSLIQTQPLLNKVKHAVTGIEGNQRGIDELVAFVAEVRDQSCTPTTGHACPPNQTATAVAQLESILCSSRDPVRIAACDKLGLKAVP